MPRVPHSSHLQVLLISADPSKVEAMQLALPPDHYELLPVRSLGKCLFALEGARSLPDVVLLDSAIGQAEQVRGCV